MLADNKRESKKILCIWIVLSSVLFIRYFDGAINAINSTMFSFSYKYGFISRGFIGSIYKWIDKIIPFDMMNYTWLYRFTICVTLLFYFLLAMFFLYCLRKASTNLQSEIKYLIVFYTIFAIPMFCNKENFGRLDIYCLMLSILAAILIIKQKCEWIVIPFSMMGVMIHQGNVFMYLNIILVLLLYRAFDADVKQRRKYILLFVLSFLSASALFLWFELFSHFNGEHIYEEIVELSKQLGLNGKMHIHVIDHEILGVDLTSREVVLHQLNMIQFPIYLIITIPYIRLGVMFVRGIWVKLDSKWEKLKYFIVMAGAITIIPDLLLKVDYGRWIFAVISYYCIVLLALLAMRDVVIEEQLKVILLKLKESGIGLYIPLIIAILLQPLCDVSICPLIAKITEVLNETFLHINFPFY